VERPRGDRVLADHGARRDLAQVLGAGLAQHLADLRRRLPHADTLLVQVDEPSLPAVLAGQVPTASGYGRHRSVDRPEAAAALAEVLSVVREAGAEPLVHCCAREVPFDLLEHAGSPGLSVDLDVLDATAYDPLAAALEAGRRVHLGVVPSTRPAPKDGVPTARSAALRVERLLDLLGVEPSDRLALTPGCGLAGADREWARVALGLVAEAAGSLA
jgi:methionine synthase II (cobalamin-independent)